MISRKLSLCILGLAASLLVSAEARLPTEGILGGDVAGANQFPYQVALQHNWEWSNDLIWCGGGIVGERFILTAAHCVVQEDGQFDTQRLLGVVGTSDLARASNARRVEVAKVYVPTGYQPQFNITFDDIALLRLNEPLGLQQHRNLRALMLPWDTRISYAGEEVEVSGFGYDWMEVVNGEEKGGKSDTKLRFAKAKVLTNAECQQKYAGAQHIYDEQICARTRQPWDLTPTGVCAGDSGGPLVHRGKTIVGVVSKSPFGCRETREPAIYTRVSSYMDFIRNAIRDKQTSDIRTFELIPTKIDA